MSCDEREFTITEMIGKKAMSSDNIPIGQITKIIDQSDNDKDKTDKICDIENDLFQIVVALSPDIFNALNESTEILFSSQTLEKVVPEGIKLKLSKDTINSTIEASLK
ncbi:MAG: hypothetical protein EAX90_04605 [Candidatus Heimdallarchaeota archaeon]|nr:hypothetical protein [Candidatus Heimdallarchaeota archaeon]